MRIAPLVTLRLDLLPLQPSHAPEMALVLADPALHVFIGGTPSTPEGLAARYERLTAGSPDPAVCWLNWVLRVRESGELAGTVQATVTGDEAEVAWVIGTGLQGRGYASEAARGMVGWLRQEGVRTVVAHVHPDHRASERVAEAAGLTRTGEWQEGEVRWRLRGEDG
ncbi:GNAT family N-acetyltransferase [Streptomyces roseirectus]|uniref:GNAT family N-acetyltransferase n=1 Tax=Streptomyces roseirectus TaxID=2768066 RepID=A0A7H0IIB5_9ACTN|nr:GNAT family N-acetyltransferase [Streptomyces roseirectus]QNP72531.1 GNAT family N-acetyltransferase [Streptomyces roseirectus]